MRPSKPASVVLIAAIAALVLSLSIAVPILFRPFYYLQIHALELPEHTGWSEETIRQAYDQVLDFCVFGAPFGTGQLVWSESGRSHFADVRELFLLDFAVLGLSLLVTALLAILHLRGKLAFHRFLHRSPGFWAGISAGGLVLVIAALAALDFQRAFVVFHALFFPGKDNWIFDETTDQIILIMPQAFFRNCAILIAAVLLTCCTVLVLTDLLGQRTRTPQRPDML